MNERKLVKRVLGGDKEAEQAFFKTYREKLYKTCVYFLGYQDAEAEDIVQDVFTIAIPKLGEFDFKHKLSSWLIQICVNLCFERLRQRKRILLKDEADIESLINDNDHTSGPTSGGTGHNSEDKLAILRNALESLGEQCREIIRLRDFEEQTYINIGKALKIPIGTVMSRLHRCKSLLKSRVLGLIGNDA